MTTDERIAKDLAVVARVSRERPTPVAATLRNVGVLREPATELSASRSSAVVMLRLSRIYALRLARASSGLALLTCTAALILLTLFANVFDWRNPAIIAELTWMSKLWVAMLALLLVSAVYIVSMRRALVRFLRLPASTDDDAATRLVRDADRRSVLAAIGGAMSFLLFFGMMQVTLGGGPLADLFNVGVTAPWMQQSLAWWTIILLVLSIMASLVGAVVVVRHATRPSRTWTLTGLGLVVATILVGFRYDIGPNRVDFPNEMPSLLLRGCLTVTGTIGLFLIVATVVLHIRAREERELSS